MFGNAEECSVNIKYNQKRPLSTRATREDFLREALKQNKKVDAVRARDENKK
jgi:hypothetical protein